MEPKDRIKIFAINKEGERHEITNLYWFEGEGVRDFNGEAFYDSYTFEIFIDGVRMYPPDHSRKPVPKA